ncbi:MAG: acyl-CoA dehydrogenase family protein, partial [Actinobacteria bacterium]|nr:acyl-CoA dehydrogenase family protein [Actinomycetota bacterium]
MHFGFDEDDDAIRDAVRSMLRAACPPSVVRDAWTAPPGALARDVWDQLVDMGVPALLVPEDEGGLGLDDRSLVQVLEEIGYAGVPLPVVESVVLAPTLGLPVGPLTATDLGGPHVPMAADADRLLLRGPGAAIHLVAPSDAVITPLASTDGARRLAEVRWVAADSTVACDDPDVVARAMDRGTVATAAVLVGLLRRLLDMT